VIAAVPASCSRSHFKVAIHDSQLALSVGVRAREKLWTTPRSKKNCAVERDVIWVPRSDAAAGKGGPSAPRRPSAASDLPQAVCTASEVASGPKYRPTILREHPSSTGARWKGPCRVGKVGRS